MFTSASANRSCPQLAPRLCRRAVEEIHAIGQREIKSARPMPLLMPLAQLAQLGGDAFNGFRELCFLAMKCSGSQHAVHYEVNVEQ